jgi:membrane associated rhomboid family serine protease
MAFNNPSILHRLKHWPYVEIREKEWYRMVSSGFVHANWIHLGVNMFVLYQFGGFVEQYYQAIMGELWGSILYIVMYLSCIAFGDLPTLIKHKDNQFFASVGASGAVSGVVFIYILVYPWQLIYLYGIIGIYSIIGGLAYLFYSQWASRNSDSRIDHDAHFYGALYGMIFTILMQPSLAVHFFNQLISPPFLG